MNIMDILKRCARLFLWIVVIGMITSCGYYPTAGPTFVTETNTVDTNSGFPSPITSTGSQSQVGGTCPPILQRPDREIKLNGSLLFGKGHWPDDNRFNTIYAMHFPDLTITTFLAADEGMEYLAPRISPNGNFLAILRAYNIVEYEAIEIYSANGELLNSIPWNHDEWYGFLGWAGNGTLVLESAHDNTLIVLDPFSETTHDVNLGLTDDIRVRGFDPSVGVFALGYINPDDRLSIDRTILWNANQKEVLWSTDSSETWIYELKWSHDGTQIALLKNRDELILLDNRGNLRQTFDLSGENILIWGVQWSLDDKQISFWKRDDNLRNSRNVSETYQDTGQFLYHLNLSNGQIVRYCFTSEYFDSPFSDIPTKTYSILVSPDYFITENYKTYNEGANIYEYEVVLVDSQNEKAYKLGDQLDLIGWMDNTQ